MSGRLAAGRPARWVRTSRQGHTFVVRLARPEARNALSSDLLVELREALHEGEQSTAAAIVVTAEDPAFCAGLDLSELEHEPEGFWDLDLLGWFADTTKPVLGAINGAAITGGFELALACDLRFASERAWFADTHTQVGVVPGWGLTANLGALAGPAFAYEVSLTGRRVTAAEALHHGIVQRVVAHEDLLDEALRFGEQVARGHGGTRARVHALYRAQQRRARSVDVATAGVVSRGWRVAGAVDGAERGDA